MKDALVKGAALSLLVGVLIMIVTSAYEGWSETIVRKRELYDRYYTREQIDAGFCNKSDIKLSETGYRHLEGRVAQLDANFIRLEAKMDALLMHFKVSYTGPRCQNPPCKPVKTSDIARGGD